MTPVCSIENIGKRKDSGNRNQETGIRNQDSGTTKKCLSQRPQRTQRKKLSCLPFCHPASILSERLPGIGADSDIAVNRKVPIEISEAPPTF
jgi:hypothetical protein